MCHPSPLHWAHHPERKREDPLLSGIQQAQKESDPIVSYLGTASLTPPGRGLATVPGVAHAEGTWKVFSPLKQPNRAGITCSVALQHAKAFFTVFCLGTTPSPQIEKPQHTNAIEKSLLCHFLPGESSLLHIGSRTHRREGTFPGQVIPGGRPSGGHQHQLLCLGAHCF